MSKAQSRAVDIVVKIIAVMLVIGAIGFLVVTLMREGGLTVYVKYGDKRYSVSTVNGSLGTLGGDVYKFDVFSIDGKAVEYSVEVSPNADNDFVFLADGANYRWSKVDCTTFFEIQKSDKSFTIAVSENVNLTDLLTAKYGDIQYANTMPDVADYFNLVVKIANGNIRMTFAVHVGETSGGDFTGGIVVTPDHIVF